MEYISVLTFVSALIYLGAGVYTFAKNKEGGVTQHFLLLSLFLSMWAFAASFAIAAPSEAKVFSGTTVFHLPGSCFLRSWCISSSP